MSVAGGLAKSGVVVAPSLHRVTLAPAGSAHILFTDMYATRVYGAGARLRVQHNYTDNGCVCCPAGVAGPKDQHVNSPAVLHQRHYPPGALTMVSYLAWSPSGISTSVQRVAPPSGVRSRPRGMSCQALRWVDGWVGAQMGPSRGVSTDARGGACELPYVSEGMYVGDRSPDENIASQGTRMRCCFPRTLVVLSSSLQVSPA